MTDELVDDLCQPCRDGRHSACVWSTGCLCAVRLGPDGRGFSVCESLLPYNPEPEVS